MVSKLIAVALLSAATYGQDLKPVIENEPVNDRVIVWYTELLERGREAR
jgi:hypothetical protein